MVLPPVAQQVIDQIIAATDDVTPDLREPMRSELTAQLEALMISQVQSILSPDRKAEFQQLLQKEPVNPDKIDSFMSRNIPDFQGAMYAAIEKLKALYLD